jgi:hypothetical protein
MIPAGDVMSRGELVAAAAIMPVHQVWDGELSGRAGFAVGPLGEEDPPFRGREVAPGDGAGVIDPVPAVGVPSVDRSVI